MNSFQSWRPIIAMILIAEIVVLIGVGVQGVRSVDRLIDRLELSQSRR